jgi:hypothetical protein
MSGKLATVIDQIEHGHYVYRAYFKHAVLKQYEKVSTFLRNQLCSSNLKDFGLRKGLDNLEGTSRKRRYGYDVQPHPRRSRNLSSWLDQRRPRHSSLRRPRQIGNIGAGMRHDDLNS